MSINIKNFKVEYDKLPEHHIIDDLMNIHRECVEKLLEFGFEYNYEHRQFNAKIEINNYIHTVSINKTNLDNKLVRFIVHIPPIRESDIKGNKTTTYLKGACHNYELYYDLTEKYNYLNTTAIFNHIYTVYRLNQEEDKATFKEFVEKEKESNTQNN